MEVILSAHIDKENLGIFANSFYLTNFEFTYKTDPSTRNIEEESTDPDADARTKKFTKHINQVVLST